jgi:hypothetical protein
VTLYGKLDYREEVPYALGGHHRDGITVARKQPVSEVCRQFGISRKTGYKWLARYRKDAAVPLVNQSRRPRRSPRQTADELEQRRPIVEHGPAHIDLPQIYESEIAPACWADPQWDGRICAWSVSVLWRACRLLL